MEDGSVFKDSSSFVATDQITGVWSFLMSIDWTESWLQAVLATHVSLLVAVCLLRRFFYLLAGLFLLILAVVYNAEAINRYGAQHWNRFSRQQYFDSSGMFISLVFSLPLIFICLVIMMLWVHQSASLLIALKRKEIRKQNSSPAKQDKKTQ